MKTVYVFKEEGVAPVDGHFETWAAFAESELEAKLHIEVKYKISGRTLVLHEQFPDRRKQKRQEP